MFSQVPGKNFPEMKVGGEECKKSINIFRSILKSPVKEENQIPYLDSLCHRVTRKQAFYHF